MNSCGKISQPICEGVSVYCTYCGVQNPDEANFCSNCGKETSKPTEEVDEPQQQVRVHHPWMTAQTQPQEQNQPQQEVHPQPQQRDQGEVPEALNAIRRRVKGWSTKKKILWGVVVGFLFLVCVGVVVGEPVEEDLAEVSAVEQSVPDDEPPDCYSGELGEYVASILVSTGAIGTAADNIASLFAQSGRSPALFLNQDWQDRMEENHKVMKDSISDIRDVEPPESVEDIHEILMDAVDDLDKGVGLSSKGVSEVDADSLSSGLPLMMSYNDEFGKYSSELTDYCGMANLQTDVQGDDEVEGDETSSSVSVVVEEPEQRLSVSFNDIRPELVDKWKFRLTRTIAVHDQTSVARGTIKDDKFLVVLRINEHKNEITEVEARVSVAEGTEPVEAKDSVAFSAEMLAAIAQLTLPEWGEYGHIWIVKSGELLAAGDNLVATTYKNARITYEFESGVLILTIESIEDKTAKSRSPEPTSTPKASEQDRTSGKHCMREFGRNHRSLIVADLKSSYGREFGLNPNTVKVTEYNIVPLGHRLEGAVEQSNRLLWPNYTKHAAAVWFEAEELGGGKVRYAGYFWVRQENCKALLASMIRTG